LLHYRPTTSISQCHEFLARKSFHKSNSFIPFL